MNDLNVEKAVEHATERLRTALEALEDFTASKMLNKNAVLFQQDHKV